tara:strand:- start:16919 stop:17809 length:891 start_codon:yes stop_codon:yes gene_type:complete
LNKKAKNKILLICNKGALASKTKIKLQIYSIVEKYIVNKKESIKSIKKDIEDRISKNEFNLVIFISGETRNKNMMRKLNTIIPKKIANLCSNYSIPLVYLSSLSVFGLPKEKVITENSIRDPYDIYGFTKNNFDLYVKKLKKLNYACIAPGSIINPLSKNKNLIDNGIRIFEKKFLKTIFMIICPSGNFACVHIDDLVKAISIESIKITSLKRNERYRKFKFCAINLNIFDLFKEVNKFKPIFRLIAVPVKFLKALKFFLHPKISMKIFVYFSNFYYLTEYDFLKQKRINTYLKKV